MELEGRKRSVVQILAYELTVAQTCPVNSVLPSKRKMILKILMSTTLVEGDEAL